MSPTASITSPPYPAMHHLAILTTVGSSSSKVPSALDLFAPDKRYHQIKCVQPSNRVPRLKNHVPRLFPLLPLNLRFQIQQSDMHIFQYMMVI